MPTTQELGVLDLWRRTCWHSWTYIILKLYGWQEHTQSNDSDPEVGRLRKLDVNEDEGWYFLRSPVAALAFWLQSSQVERLLVWRFLSQNLDVALLLPTCAANFWKESVASTQHCARNTTIKLGTEEEIPNLGCVSWFLHTDSSGYVFTPLSAMFSFTLKKLLCSGFKELDTEKSRTSSVAVACVQQVWSRWKIKRYEWRPTVGNIVCI